MANKVTVYTTKSTGGGGDVDGGFANSVYLISQIIDGGNA